MGWSSLCGIGGSLKEFQKDQSVRECQSVRELQNGLLALLLLFLMFITESLDCNYMEFLEVQGRKLFSSLR